MLSIRHVVVPVEFNEVCVEAASFATMLARRFEANITLLHVAPGADVVTGLDTPPRAHQAMRAKACLELGKMLAEVNDSRLNRALVEGDAATEIVRFAHNNQSDLILMPTRGLGAVRRFLLGSVTAKVLHDADCPVWTGMHPEALTEEGEFSVKKICCAVDLGPQTRAALKWAGEAAEAFGAELVVFHVYAPVPDPDWRGRVEKLATEQLTANMDDLGLHGEPHVVAGAIPGRIPELTSGLGCDLNVIGRGHMNVGARLGGHAYAIIRDSLCPVVSV